MKKYFTKGSLLDLRQRQARLRRGGVILNAIGALFMFLALIFLGLDRHGTRSTEGKPVWHPAFDPLGQAFAIIATLVILAGIVLLVFSDAVFKIRILDLLRSDDGGGKTKEDQDQAVLKKANAVKEVVHDDGAK